MTIPDRPRARSLDELPTDVLAVDPDQMRRLGYWVVDRVVEHFQHVDEGPVVLVGDPGELDAALGAGTVPTGPQDPIAAMSTLIDAVLTHQQHGDHARYFARVPGPSSFPAVLGEWL